MTGLLEKALTRRYGPPQTEHNGFALCWSLDQPQECKLLKPVVWTESLRQRYNLLETLYGDARGGFLVDGALKVATLEGPRVFGLYPIDVLQSHPSVQAANALDAELCFFMDSANVWYYAIKNQELWGYDAETEELDRIGPIERSLELVLAEFEEAAS